MDKTEAFPEDKLWMDIKILKMINNQGLSEPQWDTILYIPDRQNKNFNIAKCQRGHGAYELSEPSGEK